MTHTKLIDLASQVFLFISTFRRRAKRGVAPGGDEVRGEVVQIFRDLDQKAQVDPALARTWELAKPALVYLVDEIMVGTEWESRGWWADNGLENDLLGHPQKMRGILFYDELERIRKRYEQAESSRSPDQPYLRDALAVYYGCLRFGFEGKYVGQPHELERESQQILAKLPAAGKVQDRERTYFDEAYEHTVEVPPQYETAMRLATLVGLVIFLAVVFVGFRSLLWSDLLTDLNEAAAAAGDYFAGEGAP